MKYIVSIITFLMVFSANLFAQNITYYGELTHSETKKKISGVTVKVLDNKTVVASGTSSSSGSYSIQFPPGKVYTIEYSKAGLVTKIVRVNVVGVNEEDMPPGGKIFPPIRLDLFDEVDGVDFDFLKTEPVVQWYFDRDHMEFDQAQMARMKKKIEERLEQANKKNEDNEAKYSELIKDADALFVKKEYQAALDKYVSAVKIPGKQAESHPNQRIVEIGDLLQQQNEAELVDKQENQEYYNLIEAGDNLAKQKDFDKAITRFQEASKLKPQEQYPREQIELLKKAKESLANKEEYDKMIQRADGFLKQNSLQAARDTYQKAQKLMPMEEYPKQQLSLIEKKLEEQSAERELRDKYNKAIERGDQLFNNKQYAEAIEKFQEALSYESAATYPAQKMEEAEVKLAEQKAEEEKIARFNELVKAGDVASANEDYQEAISNFEEALELISDEDVKSKLKRTKEKLAEQEADKERLEKIENLMTSASENIENRLYQEAVDNYNEVLTLNKNHVKAIEGKQKAEKLLQEQKEKAEQTEQFDKLVADADANFDRKEWEQSKEKYLAAKKIFDDNEHVNNRINELTTIIRNQQDKARTDKEIEVLLRQAIQFKADNKWKEVVQKYEEALLLDTERTDVKELLAEAQQQKVEWEKQLSQEEQFKKLKKEGDQYFAKKEWSEAKSSYEAGLEIKEDEGVRKNLEIIAEKLQEEALNQEKEEAFQQKMKAGNEAANKEDFQGALSQFEGALTLKPNDVEAKKRIQDMHDKMQELANAEARLERYETAMREGKGQLNNKDYAAAIKSFDDALIEKPLDKDASALKEEAQTQIRALQSEEERYNHLLSSAADQLGKAKQMNSEPLLNESKSLYEQAQAIKPEASEPQNRIVEINELLRKFAEEKSNEAKIEANYQKAIEQGNVAAQNKQYDDAIAYMNKALGFKPNEEYPKTKIAEYQELLKMQDAQHQLAKDYQTFIQRGDVSFDNKSYEEAISYYEKALEIKDDKYPKDKISKARLALQQLAEKDQQKVYQNFIDRADANYSRKEYTSALENYKSALNTLPNDRYAQDKIDEVNQILENLKRSENELAKNKSAFDEKIRRADSYFNSERYIEAQEAYNEALELFPNDVYANERVRLSIQKAKEATEVENEKRYQQIIAKADDYFDEESWEKAIGLYERALNLRSYDTYPQERLDEIQRILNGNVVENKGLEYLGEDVGISIIEGAALLEKGAKERENLKRESVDYLLKLNEGNAEDLSLSDYQERVDFNNEIVRMQDLRAALVVDEYQEHRYFIEDVDRREKEIVDLKRQKDFFEYGDIQRINREITYTLDDVKKQKEGKEDDHLGAIERIKIIDETRKDKNRAEMAHHNVRVNSNQEELVKVDVYNEQQYEVFKEEQRAKEVRIDDIIRVRELKAFDEKAENYERWVDLQDDALLAKMKVEESTAEKMVIQDQLRDDIYALSVNLERKSAQKTQETYQNQLEVDALLEGVKNQYKALQEHKDDARQLTVEQLKTLDQNQKEQLNFRAQDKYQQLQENREEVEYVKDLQAEQANNQKKDLAALDNTLKDYTIDLSRQKENLDNKESSERNLTVNELNKIKQSESQSKSQKSQKIKENYEDVKGLEANIDGMSDEKRNQLKTEKINTQEILKGLEKNSRTFTEDVANTLGEEFPEGVSQQTFVRKDKDNIPVEIITRRIVVKNGRGDVYIRMQTRNGLTYSKNGSPATEQTWISGTENASLAKHY